MKPSNVLVRAHDGAATVMDFGIAKMTTSTRLTATGQTMGTVRYMSPEQVRGQEVDLAHRHLLARRDALRVARRRHAVRRQHALRDHDEAPLGGAEAAERARASRCRRGRGRADAQSLAKKRGGSVRDRARHAQGARGRAQGRRRRARSRPRRSAATRSRSRRQAPVGGDGRAAARPRAISPIQLEPAGPRSRRHREARPVAADGCGAMSVLRRRRPPPQFCSLGSKPGYKAATRVRGVTLTAGKTIGGMHVETDGTSRPRRPPRATRRRSPTLEPQGGQARRRHCARDSGRGPGRRSACSASRAPTLSPFHRRTARACRRPRWSARARLAQAAGRPPSCRDRQAMGRARPGRV